MLSCEAIDLAAAGAERATLVVAEVVGESRGAEPTPLRGEIHEPEAARSVVVVAAPVSHAACDAARSRLREALEGVAARAEGALGDATAAGGSADMVVMNVRMVGAMMSQIHHGIQNVAAATERSTTVAERTTDGVASTTERIDHLAALGQQIGSIVKVILGIAEQTRMLALNAKIEAARAGEHGRGFAVVADEVKDLARASAAAVDEIERRIEGISRATADAARAMHATTESVGEIHGLIREIAAGVHEQRELAESVKTYIDEAAESVDGIAQGLGRANDAIGDAITCARAALDPDADVTT
ncbi:MAG: hypothetical protein IPK07_18985 [Deltaproteobacteria bacterium]|nr:hypothetical protein [Deltaproteobacteria bacterium]